MPGEGAGRWAPALTRGLLGLGRLCSEPPLFSTAMLLLSGALVSGPYALITTAVSADLVSHAYSGPTLPQWAKLHSQLRLDSLRLESF